MAKRRRVRNQYSKNQSREPRDPAKISEYIPVPQLSSKPYAELFRVRGNRLCVFLVQQSLLIEHRVRYADVPFYIKRMYRLKRPTVHQVFKDPYGNMGFVVSDENLNSLAEGETRPVLHITGFNHEQ